MLVNYLFKEAFADALKLYRDHKLAPGILSGSFHRGYCPICERTTVFIIRGGWLRDDYQCARCASIPRWRALIQVLETNFLNWRQCAIHESSPGGASSEKLKRECANYLASHFFPEIERGQINFGFRCEDLAQQTFSDAQFDLVITQDVFEHILHPAPAFAEIARTLKPGGAHVFTVPWYSWKKTLTRAIEEDGSIKHLEPAEYHGNPIDLNGSLVVTEWGSDLCDFIREHSGLETVPLNMKNDKLGIDGEFLEVFVSRKVS